MRGCKTAMWVCSASIAPVGLCGYRPPDSYHMKTIQLRKSSVICCVRCALVWLWLVSVGWAQQAPSTLPDLQLADSGFIRAVVVQPDGRLIVAGRFSAVNGVARRNIARVNPNGSVDTTWDPSPLSSPKETDYGITALCLVGEDLFVAGTFRVIGGLARSRLAKISTSGNGAADSQWNPSPDGLPFGIVWDGTSLYVGGQWINIGGVYKPRLAKLSAAGAGAVDTTWTPAADFNRTGVTALALSGQQLYVGTRNFHSGKTPRVGGVFRVSTAGGGLIDPTWRPAPGPTDYYVDAIAVSASHVFIGGEFTTTAGVRALLVKFSAAGGGAVDASWNPAITGPNDADPTTVTTVRSLLLSGNALYVGGRFTTIGGLARAHFAKLPVDGAALADATFRADAELTEDNGAGGAALAQLGTQVIAGGSFRRINGNVALALASLDGATGTLGERYRAQVETPGFVFSIVRQADGKLIVGGHFFIAGGVPRNGLVRLLGDGTVDAGWSPATDNAQINEIVLDGNDIYVAGTFSTMGGQPRSGLAKLSAIGSDAADPDWNPNVDGFISTITATGSQLYVCGEFNAVGGTLIHGLARVSKSGTGVLDAAWRPAISRRRAAGAIVANDTSVFVASYRIEAGESGAALQKFSLTTGAADPKFKPPFRGDISSLALDGASLYAGGNRTLARLHTGTGARDGKFRVTPDNDVTALKISGSQMYAGGLFKTISGVKRNGLARIDLTGTGTVDRSWNPQPEHVENGRPGRFGYYGVVPAVYALRVEGDTVFVGGEFDTIGGEPRLSFASLAVAHAPVVLQTPGGIVVSRNVADGAEVTHFRFTRIAGGRLFLHDGLTPISEDDFISVEQAAAGLIFQPATGPSEPPRLVVVGSLNDRLGGAGTASTFVDLATLQTLPEFTLDRASYVVVEGAGSLTIEVRKAGGTAGAVDLATSDGSALAGSNYTAVATRLAFAAGDVSKTVNIAIANNAVFQGDRALRVALSATSSGALGDPSTAEVKIIDDDAVGATGSRTIIELPNPSAPPASAGELAVTLSPAQANGQWRPIGDPLWHDSGTVVTGLASGNYGVEFRAVNGFRVPGPLTVAVLTGVRTNSAASYTAISGGAQSGLIAAMLTPGFAADLATPEASRAQWRRQGEATWHNSGETVSLNSGVYIIEFKPVSLLFTPPQVEVAVVAGQTNAVTGAYLVADTPAAPKPQLLTLAQATTQQRFLFNGQIKVGDGFASGCVVQKHVVLTAAHVLFDDESLSFVADVKWFFQRQRGQYEPPPQTPRGAYVQEGYAAQRVSDGAAQEPGISTPASQMLDIATMFFLEPPGRGGSAGYLTSDAAQNEWLTTARNKMLIGYPIDGVPSNDRGKMHATAAVNLVFTRLYQAGQPVYATTGIAAFPGNSGGALCTQFTDGNYYPTAVYLGGTAQTLVRAIDASAVALINRAETSGNGGGNNVSGGSTIVGPGLGGGQFATGTLSCDLGPAAANTGGAGWRLASAVGYRGRNAKLTVAAGRFHIEFKPVPGFITPTPRDVEVIANQSTTIDGTYLPAASAITSARRVHASKGEAFQYRIIATNNATVFGAASLPAGLVVNAQTGVISGTPLEVGLFEASVTAASASAPLTILVEEPGALTVVVSGRGTVTAGFEGTSKRFVGRRYAIKATPEGNMLFDGWSGDIPAVTTTLAFTMEDGLALRANFVPNLFLTRFGNYYGLVESGSGKGIATVKLTNTGGFTMKLTLGSVAYSLVSKFDTLGNFTGEIPRHGLTPITVTLSLAMTVAEPRLSGTFAVDGNTFTLDAARANFSAKNPTPAAGKYTLTLPPDPTQTNSAIFPAGYGYASVNVSNAGGVSAKGRLGDNESLSATGVMRVDGTWVLYSPPSAKKALVAGVLAFTPHAAPEIDEISGALSWEKTATSSGNYRTGFVGDIPAAGSRYAPPVSGNAALDILNWNLVIGAGVLPTPSTATATLSAKNAFTLAGASGIKLSLNPSTGLLSGSFLDGSGKLTAFKGALLQRQRVGRGLFAQPDKTGPVTLDPP